MSHRSGGVLLLLLAWPAAWSDDKPKEPPAARASYDGLKKEYEAARKARQKVLQEAKTPEERTARMREQTPAVQKLLARFVELAEKHPKDPVAVEALTLVATDGLARGGDRAAQSKAIALLARDHVANDKVGQVVEQLGGGYDPHTLDLLRAVHQKHPDKSIRAAACLALGDNLRQRVDIGKSLATNPDLAKRLAEFAGPEAAEALKKADVAKLEAEAEQVYQEVAEKHLGEIKADKLVSLCVQLGYSTDKAALSLLRALEKHEKPEVQGNACLALGKALKGRADEVVEKDPKEAAKLRQEAESLLSRAAEKYAGVKLAYRGTVGEKAKGELYEIRHLSVGKEAPDVEGEDQDGKKFKLSDYRGKVVLLDFWSQF